MKEVNDWIKDSSFVNSTQNKLEHWSSSVILREWKDNEWMLDKG